LAANVDAELHEQVQKIDSGSSKFSHSTADADDRRKTGFHEDAGGDDDRVYGFKMIGLEAGEVVAVVQTAMLAGLPYTGLCDAILAHPTMVEGLGSLFSNVVPRSGQ
jgi:pyruvate/2-oxoglutarate dehydrogenase complex dihydrolipoamide dehydrogenase (E3) component